MCEVDQATGSLEKSYIHADGQILCQVSHGAQSTDVYYYVHDRLGSVRIVVGYDGQTVSVANGYTYRPFGAFYEGECVETVDSPFCFTGQWRDAEIDQYDLRARQYDPATMRFMTRDPVRGKMREPLTLHRYLYCLNDPCNKVDLTGEYWDGPWWAQYEFWSAIGDEIVKGAAAAADGFNPVPFYNPFESVYANADGSIDPVYQFSRLGGATSRTALMFALNAWAVNQMLGGTSAAASVPVGHRLLVGALWKGQLVGDALGKGMGLTAGTATAILGVAGVADNILMYLDLLY